MAVTVAAPAVCVADPAGTGPRCVGPLGRLLWTHDSQYFLNWDGHDNYVLRRLAPPVRSGGNVLTTLSCSASGIFAIAAILRDIHNAARRMFSDDGKRVVTTARDETVRIAFASGEFRRNQRCNLSSVIGKSRTRFPVAW
jgi:hypothetical protein